MILEWSPLRLKIPESFVQSEDHWHDSQSRRILESLLPAVRVQEIPEVFATPCFTGARLM